MLLIYARVFLIGGLLCAAAQILVDKTSLTPARILTCYVTLGAILSALGLYEPFVHFAHAGATVPLLGFGHALICGVKKAVNEQGAFGIITGGLVGTAAGITAVMTLSVAASLFAKSKRK